MIKLTRMQIGKSGLTDSFIGGLKIAFKTHTSVRISVNKRKNEIKEMAEEIIEHLGENYTYKIIGFVICLKKWRKARKSL